LKELIRIDSSTIEGVNQAIYYSENYLTKNGIECKIVENGEYKSIVCQVGQGDKTLVFNGHLDVVPGENEMFEPYLSEGKIFGRGSADMKAGCAAMMNTIIKLSKEDLNCKVMLQLVSDEEDGGLNGTKILAERGYLGDFVICGEPTNLKLSIQSKGFIRLRILKYGKSAHGSRPWEGENAIGKAMDTYNKIMKLPFLKIGSEFYDGSTVNLAKIHGGDIYNKVPDRCDIGLDIRFIPDIDPETIIEEIKSIVDGEVEIIHIGEGTSIPKDNNFLMELRKATCDSTDENDVYTVQHGSSDVRHFSKYGVPAIEFGPSGENWHGDGENAEVKSIFAYENILFDFAKKFTGILS
jgi:succinyl-diaminopimelate desuccinylase